VDFIPNPNLQLPQWALPPMLPPDGAQPGGSAVFSDYMGDPGGDPSYYGGGYFSGGEYGDGPPQYDISLGYMPSVSGGANFTKAWSTGSTGSGTGTGR
jgi:hypothetical protein